MNASKYRHFCLLISFADIERLALVIRRLHSTIFLFCHASRTLTRSIASYSSSIAYDIDIDRMRRARSSRRDAT